MSRTGLSAADLAEQFRDMCGDGSMEWVYTPISARVLFDAADMLDENAELRKERDFYFNQVTENGERAQRAIDALNDENEKLRELCEWLLNPYRLGAVTGEGVDKQWCRETYDGGSHRLRELRMEVDE